MRKRLIYLNYLQNEKESSLLYRFLQAQVTRSYPGDWVELVRKDIEYLNIVLSFEEI